MSNIARIVFFLSSAAFSAAAFADDLDDGAAICRQHEHIPPAMVTPQGQRMVGPTMGNSPFDATWAHCPAVLNAWSARKEAADAADEATNADLKKTRDLAKGLPQ